MITPSTAAVSILLQQQAAELSRLRAEAVPAVPSPAGAGPGMITPSLAAIAGCVLLGLLLCGAIFGWWAWQRLSSFRDYLSRREQRP